MNLTIQKNYTIWNEIWFKKMNLTIQKNYNIWNEIWFKKTELDNTKNYIYHLKWNVISTKNWIWQHKKILPFEMN